MHPQLFPARNKLIPLLEVSNKAVARSPATYHNISCDGNLTDWSEPTEKLATDNRNGGNKQFWCTWSSTAVYFAYTNNGFSDMDLFILIDTHSDYSVSIGSRSPPAWENMESHTLPFFADYALTIEGSSYKALRYWNGTNWVDPGDGSGIASYYISDTAGGNSELAIARSSLNNPAKIRVLALHKWDTARNILA